MQAVSITKQGATITLSTAELAFLCSAIIEAVQAVEAWEFQTRTGETQERALEIHGSFAAILAEAEKREG